MGIFDRVSRLIKSNANSAIDSLQDTAKEVEQLVLEMEEQRNRARKETAATMGQEKVARARLAAAERELPTWEQRAETAVRAGDDELAKEALSRAEHVRGQIAAAQKEVAECAAAAAAQQEALTRLEGRLREVKAKKGTIQAKVALGKQQGLSSGALDDFQRMADKIDDSESAGDAEEELAEVLGKKDSAAAAAVEAKLARLDGGDVDARLAALKRKLEEK